MRFTFRAKLFAIVGATALAFVVFLAVSAVVASRVERQLVVLQDRYVPKVELGPQLEAGFDALRRALQDAVAASDADALEATRRLKNDLLDRLAAGREVVDPEEGAAARVALEDYYATAYEVSRRMVAGETGEGLVESIATMQAKQARALEALRKTTAFDKGAVAAAFEAAKQAQASATRTRTYVSLACMGFVLLLSLWLSGGVLRSVTELGAGFTRFGKGDFDEPIRVAARDELADVATQANEMAKSLARLGAERDHADWLRTAQTGLATELRGELEPEEVAHRAVRFLARYLEAPAGALYAADGDGNLELLGGYALSGESSAAKKFREGESLVGQAASEDEIVVIDDPPADYLPVRSGLGGASPRAIVLLPLTRPGLARAVLELALFKPWTARQSELLESVRESIAIALAVARARAATRELLVRTQQQALRLASQEDALRANNEELQAQQEELKQTNEELTEQADELERQRRTLEENNTQLREARRHLEQKANELATVSTYKSRFLANMSHELRTPLNSMLFLSNLLADNDTGNLTAKQVEFSRTIYGAGKDLLALINQVLDLSKVEAGKQDTHIEPVRLTQLAEHAERTFGPLARDKGLDFVVEIEPGLPETIATDGQRVTQILNNLLANAVKFTDRGQIAFRIGRPPRGTRFGREALDVDHTIALAVKDSGRGIGPEHVEHVFAPFEQVEAASDRRYGGTGLGLTIARELAVLLGGELALDSVLGEGSTFVCYLPFEARASGKTRPPDAAPLVDDRRDIRPGDPHLLVIEDDRVFVDVFGEVIHAQGLKFVAASNGRTGLRLAKESHPNGIILDVRLPDIDGWKVMEELRRDPETADIPVHFVSAVDAPEHGMALGAIGYLTKPATQADLRRVVEALAPRLAERAHRILVVEDDPDVGDSVVRLLAAEGLDGHRVSNGHDARDALRRERFACMVLDLSLPDMDGLELLELLQKQQIAHMPQVVVYTARSLNKEETRRLEAYAEAIVLKEGPSAARLIDEIRLFVQRLRDGLGPRRHAPPQLHAVDVHLEGKKILVVDDDMRTVYALSATLAAKGAQVLTADTGRAALDVLAENVDVDAVLMDVMMPEMDGYEATRRIREDPRFRALFVVALTAKAMKGDKEKCLAAGASDYMPKPVDAESLLKLLSTRLARSAPDGA